jgi:hypothetical protein
LPTIGGVLPSELQSKPAIGSSNQSARHLFLAPVHPRPLFLRRDAFDE